MELKSELSGHFEDIVLSLFMRHREFDAYILRKAIQVRLRGGNKCGSYDCHMTRVTMDDIVTGAYNSVVMQPHDCTLPRMEECLGDMQYNQLSMCCFLQIMIQPGKQFIFTVNLANLELTNII